MPLSFCVYSHVAGGPAYINWTCGSQSLTVLDLTMATYTFTFLCVLGLFASLQVPGTSAEDEELLEVSYKTSCLKPMLTYEMLTCVFSLFSEHPTWRRVSGLIVIFNTLEDRTMSDVSGTSHVFLLYFCVFRKHPCVVLRTGWDRGQAQRPEEKRQTYCQQHVENGEMH